MPRTRGATNKTTRQHAEFARRTRCRENLPLDVMLRAMDEALKDCDEAEETKDRRAALYMAASWAEKAAPYLHPKLQATHVTNDDQQRSHEDWLRSMGGEPEAPAGEAPADD